VAEKEKRKKNLIVGLTLQRLPFLLKEGKIRTGYLRTAPTHRKARKKERRDKGFSPPIPKISLGTISIL